MRSAGRVQKIVAMVVLIAAVAMIAVGAWGVAQRGTAASSAILNDMRLHAVLRIAGEGAQEAYIDAIKKAATAKAKHDGASMAGIREAAIKAEEDARANMAFTGTEIDADIAPLNTAINAYAMAQSAYYAEESAALLAFAENKAPAATPEPIIVEGAPPADGEVALDGLPLEEMPVEDAPKIDLTGFTATAEMQHLQGIADEQYAAFMTELRGVYPELTEDILAALHPALKTAMVQPRDNFTARFARFAAQNGLSALTKQQATTIRIVNYGEEMLTIGVALIFLALLIAFYQPLVNKLELPRLIIGMFFVLLCVLAVLYKLSITSLLSNAIVRMGMNSILVLAMVPAIQCGISLNLGLPIGIIGGLLGGLLCIEFKITGWYGFFFAILVGMAISAVLGYFYALLLNRLKGSEMAVTTYVGFSVISLMCIGWLILPFRSLELRWPLGTGLRVTLSMGTTFRKILNDWWSFRIVGVTIPTGLLLFMAACCFLMWLFTRSKVGIAMQAAGANPRFAEATGINVDKMRIIGTMLSTMLGAVGIVVYSQSYGFMQLYTAPRTMGFIAASAILIGGASTSRARISHVIIGTFLFQGVLTLGMPVANMLVPQSTLSETIRILISNGIILYALTKSGGGVRA